MLATSEGSPAVLLVQDMLINGIGHRIWLGHRYFDVLDHLDGVRFFDFNRVGFFHRVRYLAFRYFGNYFVNGNLYFLLHRNMNRIGLWYLQPYNIGYLIKGKRN